MALTAAHLNAGVILVMTVHRQLYSFPLPPLPYSLPPPPFSPSLISLMVSVNAKYHVYLLTYLLMAPDDTAPDTPFSDLRYKPTYTRRMQSK